jgi:hypothetical protein
VGLTVRDLQIRLVIRLASKLLLLIGEGLGD